MHKEVPSFRRAPLPDLFPSPLSRPRMEALRPARPSRPASSASPISRPWYYSWAGHDLFQQTVAVLVGHPEPARRIGPTPSTVPPPAFIFVNGVPSPGPVTVSPPTSSTTFTFNSPFPIEPGGEPFFGLTVKLSPLSRNDTSGVAYAGVVEFTAVRGAGMPLWMVFAILGLAMAALSGSTRRRIWLLAGLMMLLAAGAPGCGGDSSGPGPSSTQTVTAVSATGHDCLHRAPGGLLPRPGNRHGLPLKLELSRDSESTIAAGLPG